jgi:hypothetical protein
MSLALGGCETEPAARGGSIVRDSAGIRIVENNLGPVPIWTLTSEPLLEIGSATDSLTGLFQVVGVHRLSDGSIAVANRGTDEIRFFNPEGEFRSAVGGTGKGPGEYDYIAWSKACGADTLYVYDLGTRRLTVLNDRGETIRLTQFMLPENALPYGEPRCQLGGPFVTPGWSDQPREPGRVRSTMPVGLIGLDGEPMTMLGEFAGTDRWNIVRNGQLGDGLPLPLGRDLSYALMNNQVVVGAGDTYEVVGLRADGSRTLQIRLAMERRPVTETVIEAYVRQQLEGMENTSQRQALRRFYAAEIEFPDMMPAYKSFLVDASGHLWIQDYPAPQDTAVVWRQFSTDGYYVGSATFPVDFEVFEIGVDFVLGVRRDENAVEYVQLFGFGSPSGAEA